MRVAAAARLDLTGVMSAVSGASSAGHTLQPCHGPAAACQRAHAPRVVLSRTWLLFRCPEGWRPTRSAPRLVTRAPAIASDGVAQDQAAAANVAPTPVATRRFRAKPQSQSSNAARSGCARAANTAAERRTCGLGQSRNASATMPAKRAMRSSPSSTSGSKSGRNEGWYSCPRSSSPPPSGLAVPSRSRRASRRI